MKPTISNPNIPERDAEARGLPKRKGKQAIAKASMVRPDGTAIHWFGFSDGSEETVDEKNNPAEWPD